MLRLWTLLFQSQVQTSWSSRSWFLAAIPRTGKCVCLHILLHCEAFIPNCSPFPPHLFSISLAHLIPIPLKFPQSRKAEDLTFHRKIPVFFKQALNTGDDIAGIVHSVGSNVYEFQKGDRVASFHEMMKPHGSFAEYAVGWAHSTFKLPKKTSFEGA
jgi:hypothetical protein